MADYRVGTSGWHYEHWRGVFYPRDLPKTKWLDFYSSRFSTVELNNTFYRLPTEAAFSNWKEQSPEGFIYAVKASRFLTHIKRLKEAEVPLRNFLDRARFLGDRLGPVLYQLPPQMARSDARLESFLSLLPADLRHVFEFRNESWLDEPVFDLLRRHNVGLCIFDMPDFRSPVLATADFAYVKFHGSASLYGSKYTDEELDEWAGKLRRLGQDLKAVYAYFNNDAEAYAVENAIQLRSVLLKG